MNSSGSSLPVCAGQSVRLDAHATSCAPSRRVEPDLPNLLAAFRLILAAPTSSGAATTRSPLPSLSRGSLPSSRCRPRSPPPPPSRELGVAELCGAAGCSGAARQIAAGCSVAFPARPCTLCARHAPRAHPNSCCCRLLTNLPLFLAPTYPLCPAAGRCPSMPALSPRPLPPSKSARPARVVPTPPTCCRCAPSPAAAPPTGTPAPRPPACPASWPAARSAD